MGDIGWKAPTVAYVNYLTTSLNALANNTFDIGATIDNETNRDMYLDLEVMLASLDLSSQTSPSVRVYLLESIDGGTDFDTSSDAETVDDNMPAVDKIIATLGLRVFSGAEAKVAIKTMIPIPPGQFKLGIRNETGVAFAATSNILAYRAYKYETT